MSTIKHYGFGTNSVYVKEFGKPSAKDRSEATFSWNLMRPQETEGCIVKGSFAFMLRLCRLFGLAPLNFERRKTGFFVTVSKPMCVCTNVLVTVLTHPISITVLKLRSAAGRIFWKRLPGQSNWHACGNAMCEEKVDAFDTREEDDQLKLWCCDVAGAILGIAAEVAVGVYQSVHMKTLLAQAVSTCDVLVVAAAAGTGVYGAPRRMRNMRVCMQRLATVDSSLGVLSSPMGERKFRALMMTVVSLFVMFIVDDFCYHARQAQFNRTWEVTRNYAGFYILWLVVGVLELQFAFAAVGLHGRFRAINDALLHIAAKLSVLRSQPQESKFTNMYTFRTEPDINLLVDSLTSKDQSVIFEKLENGELRLVVSPGEAIRRLAFLHEATSDVMQHVDEQFGLPLIAILISTLFHLIETPYFMIEELSKISLTKRIHFFTLQFMWVAFHLARLILVVEPCHCTEYEGKRTHELVCRLIAHAPPTSQLASRLEIFSRQLVMRYLTYNPMGMCTMDRSLITSLVGAVTTYLVILIQFQSVAQ